MKNSSAAIPTAVGPRELRDPLEDYLGYQFRRASLITMAALADAFEPLGQRMIVAIIVRFVEAKFFGGITPLEKTELIRMFLEIRARA